MRERTQGRTYEGQFLQETHRAGQAFLRGWAQLEGQKRKMESQQGYFFHSGLGVRAVKQMPELKLGQYQSETKQKREVKYAR
tara:strand:- start:2766 stop:3011 length:246 start_codon:yes stop_codon:yes gene_type:complete